MPPIKNKIEAEIYVCVSCKVVVARYLPPGVIITKAMMCPYCSAFMVQHPAKGQIEWSVVGLKRGKA